MKLRKDIPIIIATAFDTLYDIGECFDAGASGYISKPINMIDFIV